MLCYHSTWENGLVDGRVCVVSHIVLWPKQVQRLTSRRSNRGYDYHPVKNQTEPTVKMNRSLNFKATRKFFCTTYRTVLIKYKEKPPDSPPPPRAFLTRGENGGHLSARAGVPGHQHLNNEDILCAGSRKSDTLPCSIVEPEPVKKLRLRAIAMWLMGSVVAK